MPVNKSARLRFEIIDECLRNTAKKWTKSSLLAFVNRRLEGRQTSISASQLRYDLEAMKTEYDAPIEMYREGRQYYYRYETPDFSIKTLPVGEEDLQKLNHAVQLLQQIRAFTIAGDIASIVERLESRYKYNQAAERPIISFESSPEQYGVENLEDIYQAILRKNVLKIRYQTFKVQEAYTWQVHPYLLKEYNHRWYLLCHVAEKAGFRILALDRMMSIKVIRQPFIENSLADTEDYFREVIGVTVFEDKTVEEVELLFTEILAPYIRTKPLHHSQYIVQQYEDGSLHIRLRLRFNPEFLSLLLSYGKDVKVLRPAKLANDIKETAKEIIRQYTDR